MDEQEIAKRKEALSKPVVVPITAERVIPVVVLEPR